MIRKKHRARFAGALVPLFTAAFLLTAEGVSAQDKSALGTTAVRNGIFLITGGGCNSLVRLSSNGLIIVDGKLPGNYKALLAKAQRISEQPVRLLINTDYHDNHTGNNAQFLAAGTQILAQDNVKQQLAAAQPTKTYDREINLTLGGIEVQVRHFGNARTGGDSVVYFPGQGVVAVGDIYAAVPDPDFSAGGSLVGWGPVLGEILKLDFDVVVPGDGPLVGRADLEAFKRKIDDVVSRAIMLVRKGIPKDRLMAQLAAQPAAGEAGWKLSFTGDRLDRFYDELMRAR